MLCNYPVPHLPLVCPMCHLLESVLVSELRGRVRRQIDSYRGRGLFFRPIVEL
jgi:hypothetical protein